MQQTSFTRPKHTTNLEVVNIETDVTVDDIAGISLDVMQTLYIFLPS